MNGSYWLGTAVGAAATLVFLDPSNFALDIGWRLCFGLGAVLGLAILLVRRSLPESPRWQMTHGHADQAEKSVAEIEAQVRQSVGEDLEDVDETVSIRPREAVGFIQVSRIVFGTYPRRSILGLSLFVGQAFLYNAVFFTYALVLTTFYKVPSNSIGLYLIAFAIGNLLGPILLGRLFDVIGRRIMIAGCYLVSGLLLALTAWLFDAGVLNATTQTVAWVVVFFFRRQEPAPLTSPSVRSSRWRREHWPSHFSTPSGRGSGESSAQFCSVISSPPSVPPPLPSATSSEPG